MVGKRAIRESTVYSMKFNLSHAISIFVIPSLASPTSNLRLSCLIDPHLPAIYLNP